MEHLISEIKEHFSSVAPKEGCGVIVVTNKKLKWTPCENLAIDKDDFVICPKVYSRLLYKYRIYAIVHNHINHPPYPSCNDRKYCNQLAIPFIIFNYPTMEKTMLYPDSMNLLGREYSWGIYDCLSLAIDYYAVNKHILFDRPTHYIDNWWKTTSENYLTPKGLAEWGFKPTDNPEPGDIITFQMGASIPNHIGVLLGDEVFLHHAHNRLSTMESLYPLWGPNIVGYYTYDK